MEKTVVFSRHGLTLMPQRAVWSAPRRTLWIADLHLGKAAGFRAHGQPAPHGTTEENLRRLDELIALTSPERFVVLGDFLHARESRSPILLNRLRAWRRAYLSMDCVVVRGNHDRRAGDPPPDCGFVCVDEPAIVSDVESRHYPLTEDAAHSEGGPVLCGHIHPVVRISGPARDRLRLPCFAVIGRQVILPAFGEFTGGSWIDPKAFNEIYLTTETTVHRYQP